MKFSFNDTGNRLLSHILDKRGVTLVTVYDSSDFLWRASLINPAGRTLQVAHDPDYATAIEAVLGDINQEVADFK